MTVKALCIGINYTGSGNDLAGCINDAKDWAAQFAPIASVTQLLEQSATRAGIVGAIKATLGSLVAGDSAIITFSGHGTHITDTTHDETDGRDEALCPFDLRKNLLLDDDLKLLLADRAANTRVLLITDCCHSGTMTRDAAVHGQARYVPFAQIAAYMGDTAVGRIVKLVRQARARWRGTRSRETRDDGLVHWAACTDVEVSFDATINGRPCGAFTNAALKILRAYRNQYLKYDTIAQLMPTYLPSRQYPQTPQFSGDLTLFVPGYEPPAPAGPPPVAAPVLQVLRGILEDGRKFKLEIG